MNFKESMPSGDGTTCFIITDAFNGARLDAAMLIAFPRLGLRKRRALWDRMDIRVQDRQRPPAFRVQAGQKVVVQARSVPAAGEDISSSSINVVAASSAFAALFKPAQVHSVRGKTSGSIEEILPQLFPGETPCLLNRLDYLTSGLLLVGRSADARNLYLSLQDNGLVQKTYVALVHGKMKEPQRIKQSIDSSRRTKVRVLVTDNEDSLRHTMVTPIEIIEGNTLVRAEIRKGQRHQIRAHLAARGYPIVGDPLYGKTESAKTSNSDMFLHHMDIRIQDFHASCFPAWEGMGRLLY